MTIVERLYARADYLLVQYVWLETNVVLAIEKVEWLDRMFDDSIP